MEDLTAFFISTWWMDSKNMEEIKFSWWLFEGRLRQCKNALPDGLNWLCYFAGSSKSHHKNSISCIFLESPHQVYMKNAVKSSKNYFVFQYSRNSRCLAQHNVLKKAWRNIYFQSCSKGFYLDHFLDISFYIKIIVRAPL